MNLVENYENEVSLKYQIYNSIFLTLGLSGIHQTGIQLPLIAQACKAGLAKGETPQEIIEKFLGDKEQEEAFSSLFGFVQFIERQIVLIDALEDAAFQKIHDLKGPGSYRNFAKTLKGDQKRLDKVRDIFDFYRVRIVLTAHPTQFYPGEVLGIITDLGKAIRKNNIPRIKQLLEQLGQTPFFKKTKPTPFDEAVSLIWYLENVFYYTIPQIYEEIYESIGEGAEEIIGQSSLMKLGFWPGGDRDGNPGVRSSTTIAVADRLRGSLFRCYFRDARELRKRLTFADIYPKIIEIESAFRVSGYDNNAHPSISREDLIKRLKEIEAILEEKYNGLYVKDVRSFRHKLNVFKYHFSAIDVRQDSRKIHQTLEEVIRAYPANFPANYANLSEEEKIEALFSVSGNIDAKKFEDEIVQDTIESFEAMQIIQDKNGEEGAYRYIISNCRSALNVAEVYALANLTGWKGKKFLDIIPLFETIDDLENAGISMTRLYKNARYRKHLEHRFNKQVVMLGFSDGTKDGGYLTANWSIFKAKENITALSRENDVRVVFFDGRGGPPARGGGNTHKFYASLGPTIESTQTQLTIQGQTISSNFGTINSAKFNVEQLLTAGLENNIKNSERRALNDSQRKLLDDLSTIAFDTYQSFKNDDLFVPYLEEISPLKYYAMANIGSRPSKRGSGDKLKFEDLRAIPFVGAWSQLKQNVPGFFGLGTACKKLDDAGRLDEIKALYRDSLFFRTLIENSMQSLSKTNFELTSYMKADPKFGRLWDWMNEEHKLAEQYVLLISGQKKLLETSPRAQASIKLREEAVLPLLVIQQYALMKLRTLDPEKPENAKLYQTYEKLVIRTLYGNINAARNSA
jgi:phosphoenolpyruvate carboxylase